jgi:chromosomal replication initiation ATPase DnaA
MNQQLGLPLPHRAALERADFLVAPANQDAVAWIDRWPRWPAPGLVLHGPRAAGKSHLAQVWRARSGAALVAGATLDAEAVPILLGDGRPVVVDAAETAPEAPLLHLHNGLAEAGRQVLLLAEAPPARWGIGLADLASRLNALPAVAIGPPDDPLIRAVLIKLFADRQLQLGAAAVEFVAMRIERSFAAAAAAVAALDRASLAEGRPVTVSLARRVLPAALGEGWGGEE